MTMVDRAREVEGSNESQVIQWDGLAVAFVDLERHEPRTIAVGRLGHRLTWAAVIAAAVLYVPAIDAPVLARHARLPIPHILACRLQGSVGQSAQFGKRRAQGGI